MTSTLALVTNLHCGQASAHFFLSKNDDIEALCPTDDVFKSTVHRAINKSGKERFSIPLFFGTDYHVNIEVCGFSNESKKAQNGQHVCLCSLYQVACLPTGRQNIALLLLEST